MTPPKKKRQKPEEILQKQCVQWFRLQPKYKQYNKLFFAVPNGGSRNILEAANLKKQGVVSGVSDLILLVPKLGYHGLLIEMKSLKGTQSEAQKEFEKQVESWGYCYLLCRSFDQFTHKINEYLK